MIEATQVRLQAVVVAAAPVLGLIGATVHPYIGDLANNGLSARVIADDPARWAWAHTIEMAANVLAILAIVAIGRYLWASGERLYSFIAVPLIATALVLFASVLGMSLIWSAMVEAGLPLVPAMEAVELWYAPVTLVILLTAGLGILSLALSIYRSRVLSPRLTWLVVAATIAGGLTLLIEATWGEQLYNVTAVVAFWPLAYRMWLDATEAPVLAAGPASPRSAPTV